VYLEAQRQQRQSLDLEEDCKKREACQRQVDQHKFFTGQFVIVKKHQPAAGKGAKREIISTTQINVNTDSEDMLGGIVRWLPGQKVDSSDFVVPDGFTVIVCAARDHSRVHVLVISTSNCNRYGREECC
jgi:hypothetical protein